MTILSFLQIKGSGADSPQESTNKSQMLSNSNISKGLIIIDKDPEGSGENTPKGHQQKQLSNQNNQQRQLFQLNFQNSNKSIIKNSTQKNSTQKNSTQKNSTQNNNENSIFNQFNSKNQQNSSESDIVTTYNQNLNNNSIFFKNNQLPGEDQEESTTNYYNQSSNPKNPNNSNIVQTFYNQQKQLSNQNNQQRQLFQSNSQNPDESLQQNQSSNQNNQLNFQNPDESFPNSIKNLFNSGASQNNNYDGQELKLTNYNNSNQFSQLKFQNPDELLYIPNKIITLDSGNQDKIKENYQITKTTQNPVLIQEITPFNSNNLQNFQQNNKKHFGNQSPILSDQNLFGSQETKDQNNNMDKNYLYQSQRMEDDQFKNQKEYSSNQSGYDNQEEHLSNQSQNKEDQNYNMDENGVLTLKDNLAYLPGINNRIIKNPIIDPETIIRIVNIIYNIDFLEEEKKNSELIKNIAKIQMLEVDEVIIKNRKLLLNLIVFSDKLSKTCKNIISNGGVTKLISNDPSNGYNIKIPKCNGNDLENKMREILSMITLALYPQPLKPSITTTFQIPEFQAIDQLCIEDGIFPLCLYFFNTLSKKVGFPTDFSVECDIKNSFEEYKKQKLVQEGKKLEKEDIEKIKKENSKLQDELQKIKKIIKLVVNLLPDFEKPLPLKDQKIQLEDKYQKLQEQFPNDLPSFQDFINQQEENI